MDGPKPKTSPEQSGGLPYNPGKIRYCSSTLHPNRLHSERHVAQKIKNRVILNFTTGEDLHRGMHCKVMPVAEILKTTEKRPISWIKM